MANPGWNAIARELSISPSPTLSHALLDLKRHQLISHVHYAPVRGAARRAFLHSGRTGKPSSGT
jgi:hypothetical protein